jgi:phospholipase/lecithinase/hemolysin
MAVVWAGANDFFFGVDMESSDLDNAKTVARQAAERQAENVRELFVEKGAQVVVVPNLPPLDQLPALTRSSAAVKQVALEFSRAYNMELVTSLRAIQLKDARSIIVSPDVFNFLRNGPFDAPENFGFPKGLTTEEQCLQTMLDDGTGASQTTICDDPSQYFFYDDYHFSTALHNLIGHFFFQEISNIL